MNKFIKNYITNHIYIFGRIECWNGCDIITLRIDYDKWIFWISIKFDGDVHEFNKNYDLYLDDLYNKGDDKYIFDINTVSIGIDTLDDSKSAYNAIKEYLKNNEDFIYMIILLKEYIQNYNYTTI